MKEIYIHTTTNQEKSGSLDTIRFSVTTHRGCYGECNFCSITVHQGRIISDRSKSSILKEISGIMKLPDFKGYIQDVGGPTANMYGTGCMKYGKMTDNQKAQFHCIDKRCLYPDICVNLNISHQKQIELLNEIRNFEVMGKPLKKAFVNSGVRYDMILEDKAYGIEYLTELINYHISGQLKVAPEHSEDNILKMMGKPDIDILLEFKKIFDLTNQKYGKNQFLTYYFIAAHPGCTQKDMQKLLLLLKNRLHINPEQVQIFMPTPSTYSALMHYTGIDPFTGEEIFVEKDTRKKEIQKITILKK